MSSGAPDQQVRRRRHSKDAALTYASPTVGRIYTYKVRNGALPAPTTRVPRPGRRRATAVLRRAALLAPSCSARARPRAFADGRSARRGRRDRLQRRAGEDQIAGSRRHRRSASRASAGATLRPARAATVADDANTSTAPQDRRHLGRAEPRRRRRRRSVIRSRGPGHLQRRRRQRRPLRRRRHRRLRRRRRATTTSSRATAAPSRSTAATGMTRRSPTTATRASRASRSRATRTSTASASRPTATTPTRPSVPAPSTCPTTASTRTATARTPTNLDRDGDGVAAPAGLRRRRPRRSSPARRRSSATTSTRTATRGSSRTRRCWARSRGVGRAGSGTRNVRLVAKKFLKGATIEVRCTGRGCPSRSR